MNKIAIYGGSFNPFHVGHLRVVTNLLDSGIVDKVWIIPCKRNPLKKNYEYFSDEERLESIYKLVHNLPNVEIIEDELNNPNDVTYTSETLKRLSEKYPEHEFFLTLGVDEWQIFNQWKNWEWIIDNYTILVHPRDGWTYFENGYENVIYLKNFGSLRISATDIRNNKNS